MNKQEKKKILLTHAYGPKFTYGNKEGISASYSHRFTKGQDIFRKSIQTHIDSLHLLAQNIQIPAIVLEFPNLNDFKKEISKGYDYLGISHNIIATERVLEMCRLTRQISPKTKIILGGYGVVSLPEIFKEESDLKQVVDHLCHSEGVGFLRSLLGEEIDRPIQQRFPGGNVLSGLGCICKCDFCAPSAFYGGKYIKVASAKEIYQYLKENYLYLKGRTQIVFDDNFFSHRLLVREFSQLMKEDKAVGLRYLGYSTNSTIDAVASYSQEELLLSGVDLVFLGVESLFSSFEKNQGIDIRNVFKKLHDCGILTCGAMIVGLDCQDTENIEEDINFYISLGSTVNQVASLVALPGTPLWDKHKAEGRLIVDLPWENFNKDEYISAKNFSKEQIIRIMDDVYRRVYLTWGQSQMRALRTYLNGFCYCKDSKNKSLKEDKAFYFESEAKRIYPILKVCYLFSPSQDARKFIKDISDDYLRIFGKPNRRQVVISNLLVGKFTYKKAKYLLFGKQPKKEVVKKYYYPNDGTFFDGRPYRCQSLKKYFF